MLNQLNQTIQSVSSDIAEPFFQVTSDITEMQDHPSYQKGYEMGVEAERGTGRYTINPKDAIHQRAYAAGYNAGLEES